MTVKITASWLHIPAVARIRQAFEAGGAEARFVGGCVRNALLKEGASDIDMAINVEPLQTIALLEKAGLRAAPTGLDHGTVTAIADDMTIEVTSLRRDVATDGRRAVVAFTKCWEEDAQRRDFTMNALYANGEGRVFDPTGQGLADLGDRRLRFIGAASERIREDYLRTLRFFRFYAWYGASYDDEDLSAMRALKSGVSQLAKERVGAEMRKLLAAPSPLAALRLMAQTEITKQVWPDAPGAPEALEALERFEQNRSHAHLPIRWAARLAAMIPHIGAPKPTAKALRLSKADASAVNLRVEARAQPPHAAAAEHGEDVALDALAAQYAPSATQVEAVKHAAQAIFPLAAKDLMAAGVAPGPALGAHLKAAKAAWISSRFTLDKAQLLAQIGKHS